MLPRLTMLILALAVASSCASPPPPPPAPPPTAPAAAAAAAAAEPATTAEPEQKKAPASLQEALAEYSSKCPVPLFKFPQPQALTIAGVAFELSGSTLTRAGGERWQGPLKIGVLGAVKDAEPATRENVKKAAAAFKQSGVHAVVANGDLVGEAGLPIAPVVKMLGEELVGVGPVLAHSGNYEWTSAFTEAFVTAAQQWPQLVDMNLVRDVDFGGIHVVSLPGYFNRKYLQAGACFYSSDDVTELTRHAQSLLQRGDIMVLTSHGPPLGAGPGALDLTYDGANVGDAAINSLLTDGYVRFGIFSHILEAGGRAIDDVDGKSPLKLPMKPKARSPRLYVNVGASSSFPWAMLGGKTSRGMAAVVTVDPAGADGGADGGGARVDFVTLR